MIPTYTFHEIKLFIIKKKNLNHLQSIYTQILPVLPFDTGSMLTYDQFSVKYMLNINFMQFFSVVSAIPRVLKYNRNIEQSLNQAHLIAKLCQSIQPSKVAYTKVITQTVQFPIPLVE